MILLFNVMGGRTKNTTSLISESSSAGSLSADSIAKEIGGHISALLSSLTAPVSTQTK